MPAVWPKSPGRSSNPGELDTAGGGQEQIREPELEHVAKPHQVDVNGETGISTSSHWDRAMLDHRLTTSGRKHLRWQRHMPPLHLSAQSARISLDRTTVSVRHSRVVE